MSEIYTLKTVLGSFDYEVITVGNKDYVSTVSYTNGNRYLRRCEIPKPILQFLKNCGYKIALYNANQLNRQLGLFR
jgi:hypothetical protein